MRGRGRRVRRGQINTAVNVRAALPNMEEAWAEFYNFMENSPGKLENSRILFFTPVVVEK